MDAAIRAGSGIDFVAEFAVAADWFGERVARTHARAPVVTCGEWDVRGLVAHLGNIHAWSASIVETGAAAPRQHDQPPSSRSRRLAEWYVAKAEDLYAVLRTADPAAPCWNFAFPEGEAAFWLRRQTHETLMHGIDLAMAGDHQERMPLELAADGIDETLHVFLRRMHDRGHPADLHRPIELRATDAQRAWVVEPAPRSEIPRQAGPERELAGGPGTPPLVVPGSQEGVADRVEAPAAVLLKLLWKRATPDDLDVVLAGDAGRVRAFLASRLTS